MVYASNNREMTCQYLSHFEAYNCVWRHAQLCASKWRVSIWGIHGVCLKYWHVMSRLFEAYTIATQLYASNTVPHNCMPQILHNCMPQILKRQCQYFLYVQEIPQIGNGVCLKYWHVISQLFEAMVYASNTDTYMYRKYLIWGIHHCMPQILKRQCQYFLYVQEIPQILTRHFTIIWGIHHCLYVQCTYVSLYRCI